MSGHWGIDWVLGTSVHGGGWIAAAAIAAWLLLYEPLAGRAAYRRLQSALDRGEPHARMRCYRKWTWQGWLLALLVVALSIGVIGWTPAQLGLRAMHLPGLPGGLSWASLGAGAVVGALGFGGAALLASRRARRVPSRPRPPAAVAGGMQLLPRTRGERGTFALLAITAGVTEEIVWRGFLLALLVALFPGAPLAIVIVAMAAAFGWAHLYQGRTGILGTGVLGGMLAVLYVASGSLLPSMLVHAAIDLAAMLRPLPADMAAAGDAPTHV